MKKIYTGGPILTMANPMYVPAVLTDDGVILRAGEPEELSAAFPDAELCQLDGAAMLPAFIDAHSHLSAYAGSFLQVPLEECACFDDIAGRIRSFIAQNGVAPGEWVIGKGWDQNRLSEKRPPSAALLDGCAPENPVVIQHASGHTGVFSSLALGLLGVTGATRSPDGGKIELADGRPTGYMEENAYFTYMKKVPMADEGALAASYERAQESYAAHGITFIQEGMAVRQMIPLYRHLLGRGALKLPLVAYAAVEDAPELFAAFPGAVGRFDGNFKIGGYKIFLDGSPQARTAWMREPYLGGEPGFCGGGTMEDGAVADALRLALKNRLQILAHCNGDGAAAQFIAAVDKVSREGDIAALRPVMIHAQLLGLDQLSEVRRLGILPSFFAAHVYHWGDVHLTNFGPERAAHISPAASALREGIRFTFHQDTPVIEPDMLETVWCAVCRRTRAGVTLGPEERITVSEALRAVTINSAYQYFEEGRRGSIEPGKEADFVILDRDPLAVPPEELRGVRVLRTIMRDSVIFDAM